MTSVGVNPLIAALDSDDPAVVEGWADALAGVVGHLKVGLQAFTANGPALVEAVARRAPVFLDLKLHDIPNTVAGAARAVAALGTGGSAGGGHSGVHGVAMLTVHAAGGPAMLRAAVEAAPDVAILAVTVLTSLDDAALAAVGQPGAAEQVPRLAAMAVEAGAAGVVCSPLEVAAVRAAVGADALIVVPGIRPPGAPPDDQARTATPAEALAAGATHLVVGRPLTRAADPAAAARALLAWHAARP